MEGDESLGEYWILANYLPLWKLTTTFVSRNKLIEFRKKKKNSDPEYPLKMSRQQHKVTQEIVMLVVFGFLVGFLWRVRGEDLLEGLSHI